MSASKIADYGPRALSRILEQFKHKWSFEGPQLAAAAQVQAVENALWDLLTLTDIDHAIGDALDQLGKLVGERRGGQADADYRLRVRARILANRSCGTIEHVLRVFRALLAGVLGYSLVTLPAYPAGFVLRVDGVALTVTQLQIFARFLFQIKGAAIAAWFGWVPVPDEDAFTCSVSCFLSGPTIAGDTSYPVYDSGDFPTAGTFIADEGLATEETLSYASKTPTALALTAPATQAHVQGSNLSLDPSPGKGWGDEGDATVGGQLAGVLVI